MKTKNIAQFFTSNPHISWVLLVTVVLWGTFGYQNMPKRKDPDIPVRKAVAICAWPGVNAEKVEQLVTRRIEERISENSKVTKVTSNTRDSVAVVYVELDEKVSQTGKEFDDIKAKLDSIHDLPEGTGQIIFIKDFGDTAALMLTVASPKVSPVEIELRAKSLTSEIARVRNQEPGRSSIFLCYPQIVPAEVADHDITQLIEKTTTATSPTAIRRFRAAGCSGADFATTSSEQQLRDAATRYFSGEVRGSEIHPDAWGPIVVQDLTQLQARLSEQAGDKYSYKDLDDYTDLIQKTLLAVPQATKIGRQGVLEQHIFLDYSQQRLAAYNFPPSRIRDLFTAGNTALPGGMLEISGHNLTVTPNGDFTNEEQIRNMLVATTPSGAPVYLRDLVDVSRGYESPARYLNYFYSKGPDGKWLRSRAITLSVQMRPGEQIGEFGKEIEKSLGELRTRLPEDLIIARTSDQPLQVHENVSLFMNSLGEAIILVVLIALIGFWDWRTAILLAVSIPLTLAMTYGMMHTLGIDVQQVSVASLIIALGLLVDVPVVASDAIRRELSAGVPQQTAAWRGPTEVSKALLYATITNIVAYLPFLMLTGDIGQFLYSLPIVMTCSLVASMIISMTLLPLMSHYFSRSPNPRQLQVEQKLMQGFAGLYRRVGNYAMDHRWKVLGAAAATALLIPFFMSILQTQFFPKDLSYLSYVDVWLPEDASLKSTDSAAQAAENAIRRASERFGEQHRGKDGKPKEVLQSLTTFVGGGGPRFWFSVEPEMQQLNYAQIIVQVKDKHDTNMLVADWQRELSASVPGARCDVRQLETGKPVGVPVSIRLSGQDSATLRKLSSQVQEILRGVPQSGPCPR